MPNKDINKLLNDDAVLAEIGRRLTRRRLDVEWTQAELAKQAGVSKRTVERLEAGNSVNLLSFIRLLRALDLLSGLEQTLPQPGLRPMELLARQGEERKRAPRKRSSDETDWSWGEE